MKRKLEAGTHLIVDRYAYSGVAFSTAKVRLLLSQPAFRHIVNICHTNNLFTRPCLYLTLTPP